MNKAYRVVRNNATGVWTAVSETARGHGKGRSVVRAVGAALIASAALLSAPGAMAQTLIEQPDDGGAINIGRSVTGTVVDFTSGANDNRRLTGIANGLNPADAVSVNQLNGTLTALGGRINSLTGAVVAPVYTLGADSRGGTTYSTVPGALGNLDDRIKGNAASIVNNTTNITNLTNGTAGMVQQATAGAEITVAKDTDGDAVNFAGKDADGNTITRKLSNVTAGTDDTDAVNVGQLNGVRTTAEQAASDANQAQSRVGNLEATAVTYDDASKGTVTFNRGGEATQLKNVAAGTDDADAVNVRQLKDAGLVDDHGNVANAVIYDDASKSTITLNRGGDAVHLKNVADGVDNTDAVNVGQLNGVKTTAEQAASDIAAANTLNASNATAVSNALGGGSTVGDDGKITAPTYSLATSTTDATKQDFNNVGDALNNLDGRTSQNTTDITNLSTQIGNGSIGLVQQADATSDITVAKDTAGANVSFAGKDADGNTITRKLTNVTAGTDDTDAANVSQIKGVQGAVDALASTAVQYDDASKGTVTFNRGGAATQLKNVAAGTDDTDAVNVRQLKDAGLVDDHGNVANAVLYDDATKTSVTFNNGGAAVRLQNVADGMVATDAVNLGQLNTVAGALGGGASFSGGVWTAPTYSFLDGSTHNSVGDALSNLDNRLFSLADGGRGIGQDNPKFVGTGAGGNASVKEDALASGNYATASGANAVASGQGSTATGANAVAKADNSVALGANSVADRAGTVSVGSLGSERIITNVMAGTQDTDAVNKAQLDRVDAKVADVQSSVGNLQSQVGQLDTKVNRLGAMNAAMSTMVASAAGLQTDNRMAVGTGVYRGQAALAIGYQRKIGSRATVTIGGSTAGGSEYNVGVGAGYGW
ncbi:ESPR-type extended signal peptide-containing protein [Ralstonia flaminis]|jgi:autotransporter adhesin|uniref:Adhesin n=1 Tax=Ralstonia flaminis TaxID=3058597 RepID=A0ABM9K4R7_9RALS|nr:ESPR-type extended signal peptide-containing protein [Ralstonia sp. LMG 18101]CAJ0813560.1 hypothetical protein LMG18101_01955 [Ralstonia sp. LMG 18101]